MVNEIAQFVRLLIKTFSEGDTSHKDSTALALIIILFSNHLPLEHELFAELIPLSFEMTCIDNFGLMSMGKVFIFRILNRFLKERKVIIEKIPNTPVKRNI